MAEPLARNPAGSEWATDLPRAVAEKVRPAKGKSCPSRIGRRTVSAFHVVPAERAHPFPRASRRKRTWRPRRKTGGRARDCQEKAEAGSEFPGRSYGTALGFDDAAGDLLDAKRGVIGKNTLLGGREVNLFEFIGNVCGGVKIEVVN